MTRRSLLLRAVLALVVAVAVNGVLTLLSHRHDVVLVTLVVCCLVAVVAAVVDGAASLTPARWRTERLVDHPLPRPEATLRRYERLLEQHWAARRRDTDLQRRLLGLARRRLAQVDGPERTTDLGELRKRLGPGLAVLAEQAPRRLTPAQIDHIIDRIEEL